VLGVPVGSDDYVKETIRDQVCKAGYNMFKARDLNDPQMELFCYGAAQALQNDLLDAYM
jgi:hypothetical protein